MYQVRVAFRVTWLIGFLVVIIFWHGCANLFVAKSQYDTKFLLDKVGGYKIVVSEIGGQEYIRISDYFCNMIYDASLCVDSVVVWIPVVGSIKRTQCKRVYMLYGDDVLGTGYDCRDFLLFVNVYPQEDSLYRRIRCTGTLSDLMQAILKGVHRRRLDSLIRSFWESYYPLFADRYKPSYAELCELKDSMYVFSVYFYCTCIHVVTGDRDYIRYVLDLVKVQASLSVCGKKEYMRLWELDWE